MTAAWVLVIFACQLAPGAPMTPDVCKWSAVAAPFADYQACRDEGRARVRRAGDFRPANWVWTICLSRDDVIVGEPA